MVDPDEDDDEDICTIIVALMQMDRRKLKREGGQNLTMGYDIFQVQWHMKPSGTQIGIF